MNRPPIKAITAIKNYCDKTQCRRCFFGFEDSALHNYVGCRLLETTPCDWEHVYIDNYQSGVIVDYLGNEYKYREQPPGVYLEDTAYYFDIASDYIDYIKGVQYVR